MEREEVPEETSAVSARCRTRSLLYSNKAGCASTVRRPEIDNVSRSCTHVRHWAGYAGSDQDGIHTSLICCELSKPAKDRVFVASSSFKETCIFNI
jgi:hypothetical protein